MDAARLGRVALSGTLVLACACGPALSADWQVSTGEPYPKVGYAEDMNFHSLYFFCDVPSGVTMFVDDGEGLHRPGSRVSVTIAAGGNRYPFDGVVETNEMDDTSMMSVSVEEGTATAMFKDLASASSAHVIWPKTEVDVPLNGSSKALKAFLLDC